jgi:glycosyltransferase involved in cell wall biosynthesis
MPLVSVLLPVRDAGPYLSASLASLWRQTLADFEVVAVDDGSRDGSGEALDRAARRESRLRVVHTPPRGLPAALNTALARARAPLVARQDADDLSHRRRFALQRGYLLAHPRVAALGSRIRLFPRPAVTAGMRHWVAWHNALLTHEAMAHDALIDSPLTHGSAMLRRRWLERVGGWRDLGWPEDVDLWIRLLRAGARLAKLPETLYGWRQHAASATRRDPRYGPERYASLRLEALERGILSRAASLTLVGVGATLRAWGARLDQTDRSVTVFEAARPAPGLVRRLAPPVVLVFGARPARDRWRSSMLSCGMREMLDFIFVA